MSELEKLYAQCCLNSAQREIVAEMIAERERRIADLVKQVNELVES